MRKEIEYCCDSMKYYSTLKCDIHTSKYDCPDLLIHSDKKGKNFKIIVHDGGLSGIEINYCPWCGNKL